MKTYKKISKNKNFIAVIIIIFYNGANVHIGWGHLLSINYNNKLFIIYDIKIGIYDWFDKFVKAVSVIWRLLPWGENKIFLWNSSLKKVKQEIIIDMGQGVILRAMTINDRVFYLLITWLFSVYGKLMP